MATVIARRRSRHASTGARGKGKETRRGEGEERERERERKVSGRFVGRRNLVGGASLLGGRKGKGGHSVATAGSSRVEGRNAARIHRIRRQLGRLALA